MEDQLLELLEAIIEGRNDFFIRTMQLTPHQSRPQVLSRYMLNEVCILELLNRLYQNYNRNNSTAVVTFSMPSNFSDPIVVAPTPAQIAAALEDIQTTDSNCAICQDVISSGGCRIRHCSHYFHRSCLATWFGISVRCPVCRHDIREEPSGASTQTPSDEE